MNKINIPKALISSDERDSPEVSEELDFHGLPEVFATKSKGKKDSCPLMEELKVCSFWLRVREKKEKSHIFEKPTPSSIVENQNICLPFFFFLI